MENQTNYAPQTPQENSSGANTVLIVILILVVAGLGYWWYSSSQKAGPADENGQDINIIDVNLPPAEEEPATEVTP